VKQTKLWTWSNNNLSLKSISYGEKHGKSIIRRINFCVFVTLLELDLSFELDIFITFSLINKQSGRTPLA